LTHRSFEIAISIDEPGHPMHNSAKNEPSAGPLPRIPSSHSYSGLRGDGTNASVATAGFATAAMQAGRHREETFYTRRGKRALDLAVAALASLIVLPLVPLVALAIKLDSPKAPVLYKSIRLGKDGRPFIFYKFRSMVAGADESVTHLRHLNEVKAPVFKCVDDPRVTRVGRFLRRASIDEIPQLWNVLKGDMTLVGPRPPIPEEVDGYEPWQRQRLDVTPGITCLWQVSGRSKLGFDEWMRLDMQYIRNRSLLLDLRILLRTLPAVLSGEGAY
jgi:lipopolysaccharide/colanic/teichoic acid biosynthesis glycosyltransferase